MQRQFMRPRFVAAILFFATLLSTQIAAACCPTGGSGVPKASTGLGESLPPAQDLAADPAWQVYEFERGGIRYLQINDSTGTVRAAVGRVDDVLWVMPVGTDADRVSLEPTPTTSGSRTVLYRSTDIEVVRISDAAGERWEVRSLHAAY